MSQKPAKLPPINDRIRWVDYARGAAILLMIAYHTAYNLNFAGYTGFGLDSGIWLVIGRISQLTFLTMVGFGLFISYQRHIKEGRSYFEYLVRHFTRAGKLFLVALLVTLVTYVAFPESYVRFGVLHLISFGIAFGAVLVHAPVLALIGALLVFYQGYLVQAIVVQSPWLVPFGLVTKDFFTLDYFPIFPWMGFVFLGISMAHAANKWGLLKFTSKKDRLPWLSWMSRHALAIYLIHLPVIFGIVWLIGLLAGGRA
jgi:uncharacterized membrane protein